MTGALDRCFEYLGLSDKEIKELRKNAETIRKCDSCGNWKKDVIEREDPYESEIHHDHTLYWLCDECYYASSDEI
jgi:hypothetical protein